MAATSLTTRIDASLKQRLQKIAEFEDRSTSYIANQAIQALVEDREYTYGLIEIGLQQIESGASISEDRVDDWMKAWADGADLPFPKADAAAKK